MVASQEKSDMAPVLNVLDTWNINQLSESAVGGSVLAVSDNCCVTTVSNHPSAFNNLITVSSNPTTVSNNPTAVSNNSMTASNNPMTVSNNPMTVSNNPITVSNILTTVSIILHCF